MLLAFAEKKEHQSTRLLSALTRSHSEVERSGLGLQIRNAAHHDTDDTADFKTRMLLAFAEKKEHQLGVTWDPPRYRRDH
jgi:hypothetical protein